MGVSNKSHAPPSALGLFKEDADLFGPVDATLGGAIAFVGIYGIWGTTCEKTILVLHRRPPRAILYNTSTGPWDNMPWHRPTWGTRTTHVLLHSHSDKVDHAPVVHVANVVAMTIFEGVYRTWTLWWCKRKRIRGVLPW
eukprot:scaffold85246_cov45-Attheya_sp.AAC.1